MSKIKALDFLKKLELGAGSFSAYVLVPEASLFHRLPTSSAACSSQQHIFQHNEERNSVTRFRFKDLLKRLEQSEGLRNSFASLKVIASKSLGRNDQNASKSQLRSRGRLPSTLRSDLGRGEMEQQSLSGSASADKVRLCSQQTHTVATILGKNTRRTRGDSSTKSAILQR